MKTEFRFSPRFISRKIKMPLKNVKEAAFADNLFFQLTPKLY